MKNFATSIGFIVFFSAVILAQSSENTVVKKISYLAPKNFSVLQQPVIEFLENRNCQIPQSPTIKEQHNVIFGDFGKSKQKDVAVLCTINKISKIFIFWNGSSTRVSELSEQSDETYFQKDYDGSFFYSRIIEKASAKRIRSRNPELSGFIISHDGIEDAFIEKASVIHYYSNKWNELSGAD